VNVDILKFIEVMKNAIKMGNTLIDPYQSMRILHKNAYWTNRFLRILFNEIKYIPKGQNDKSHYRVSHLSFPGESVRTGFVGKTPENDRKVEAVIR
jgi:hypothetical protein